MIYTISKMKLSNEYKYQNYDKEYITKHSTGIKSTLNIIANSICYNTIPQNYIDKAIKNFDYGYVYRDTTNYDNIIGIVLWSIRKSSVTSPNELYIRLMCGKKLGILIFNDIESYALTHNIKTIILSPSNDIVKNIYIKHYGFKFRGFDKQLKLNIYYKNINNINTFSKRNKTIKHLYRTNRLSRTLKKSKPNKNKNDNNLNRFMNNIGTKKIINLTSS
jgi:hypothetical protein